MKATPKVDHFVPLSKDDLDKVNKAMRASDTTLLIQKFNIPVHGRDLRTLSGSSWLNDEVHYPDRSLTFTVS